MPAGTGPVRRLAGLLREDATVAFLPVDGDAQGVAQLAVPCLLLGRVALADHRIEPVEAEVPVARLDALREAHAALLEARLHHVGIVGIGEEIGTPVGRSISGTSRNPCDELGAQRRLVLLDVEHQLVDEGQLLAAVVEQARLLVAGHALARVRGTVVVGVAHQHVAAVRVVLDRHVGSGAYRPHVQRQAVLGHAGLGVELVGLPRHRRGEGQRHPVLPLRVLALDADAKGVLVERDRTVERVLAKVEEGLVQCGRVQALAQLLVFVADQLAVVLQAEHVLREDAVDRRVDARRGVALECVDEVVGDQFARAAAARSPAANACRASVPRSARGTGSGPSRPWRTPGAARTGCRAGYECRTDSRRPVHPAASSGSGLPSLSR